ncbi:hypothetical protein BC938DRAFT_480941 [Jimgerdemannia flammicorona]|uniref:F-box domain-containing protein n=1 Tax=Jimgerdemannia flammicorona TaxID=994334 RepID=A0A433QHC3_9FUNG|nr:hypothetical protein BC938DRAFT_480941 [Jimgerdemannia flammicorona]
MSNIEAFPLLLLPFELLGEIVTFLSPNDVHAVYLACRLLSEAAFTKFWAGIWSIPDARQCGMAIPKTILTQIPSVNIPKRDDVSAYPEPYLQYVFKNAMNIRHIQIYHPLTYQQYRALFRANPKIMLFALLHTGTAGF